MVLNDPENINKIANLLNIPINTVEYIGCWSKNTVTFRVGLTEQNGSWISGVGLTVTHDFKIHSVERIYLIKSNWWKKYPTKRVKLPIYQAYSEFINNPKNFTNQ